MIVGHIQAAAKGSLAFRMVSPVSGSYPILAVSERVPQLDAPSGNTNLRNSERGIHWQPIIKIQRQSDIA